MPMKLTACSARLSSTYRAARDLLRLADRYPETVAAIGDLNTIDGAPKDNILAALREEGAELVLQGYGPTFYGAHFNKVSYQPSPALWLQN